MTHWISTWFYTQSKQEGGDYAQVRGDSSTEAFRDVYRRCLGVFFLSARKANPDAQLVLYLNKPWDVSSSKVALEVWQLLEYLKVSIEVIQYKHHPPASFSQSWRNQFFVLDVLAHLAAKIREHDCWMILDSDIVWSTRGTERLWSELSTRGTSTYVVGYPRSKPVNGISVEGLRALAEKAFLDLAAPLEYSGGEFLGGNGASINDLRNKSESVWTALMAAHQTNHEIQFEEAHLLSLSYALLGVAPGGVDPYIRRLWTQPFKYQNVESKDAALALWHVPAEKKYGIRRLYVNVVQNYEGALLLEPERWVRKCQGQLGIPSNSISKVARDAGRAITARTAARVRRAAKQALGRFARGAGERR